MTQRAQDEVPMIADYESTPLLRSEYIMAVVHLYRGEVYRATAWRIRLDNTTNWAVFTTAGLLSFAFGEGVHSHWIILIGIILISVFWGFESRRFRYSDIWYARVRMIEENFYGPILRRDPKSPEAKWGQLVAEDLFRPRFKISRLYALRERLVHNYWAIYVVLLFAWSTKVLVHPVMARSWIEVRDRLGDGLLPWWSSLAYVGLFFGAIGSLALFGPRSTVADHGRMTP